MYEPKHPILKRTLQIILTNISRQKYIHSVHQLTGPPPYSMAVHAYLREYSDDNTIRIVKDNYIGIFQFKTILSRIHGLFHKKKHWRYLQQQMTVYKIVPNPEK